MFHQAEWRETIQSRYKLITKYHVKKKAIRPLKKHSSKKIVLGVHIVAASYSRGTILVYITSKNNIRVFPPLTLLSRKRNCHSYFHSPTHYLLCRCDHSIIYLQSKKNSNCAKYLSSTPVSELPLS